jgi:hypothetical protein
MASLNSIFGADQDQQANGKWVDYGKVQIKIAFAGEENPRYLDTLEKNTRGVRSSMGSSNTVANADSMPEVKEALMRVYSKCVIKDWKGVDDLEGKPLAFSEKECFLAFQNTPAFFRWARDYADDINNFQPEIVEGDSKNS